MVSALDWKYRHSVLFDALEFLHSAYKDKRIDLAKYAEARQGNGCPRLPFGRRKDPPLVARGAAAWVQGRGRRIFVANIYITLGINRAKRRRVHVRFPSLCGIFDFWLTPFAEVPVNVFRLIGSINSLQTGQNVMSQQGPIPSKTGEKRASLKRRKVKSRHGRVLGSALTPAVFVTILSLL